MDIEAYAVEAVDSDYDEGLWYRQAYERVLAANKKLYAEAYARAAELAELKAKLAKLSPKPEPGYSLSSRLAHASEAMAKMGLPDHTRY